MTEVTSTEPARAAEWRTALSAVSDLDVRFDVPLASKVAFRIGGPADAYVRPRTAEALAAVLAFARDRALPVTLLGTGSNVLVSDRGIRGITLRLAGALAEFRLEPDAGLLPQGEEGRRILVAGAGALNGPLVAFALAQGLVGLEFLATIPGTFGGALIMNAGAHGGEIGPFVETVTLIDRQLQVVTRAGAEAGFRYRGSGFAPGEILTSATLRVPVGDAGVARAHLDEMRARRKETQPLEHPNAGSIFKNPAGHHAGRLIEAVGAKGWRRGGAEISPKHANFIVNLGGARAVDVVALADEAARAVRERFGVELEWEVKRIGDWSDGDRGDGAVSDGAASDGAEIAPSDRNS